MWVGLRRLTKKEKKKGNNHKSSKRELLTAPGLEGARGGKRKYWIPLVIRWEPPGERCSHRGLWAWPGQQEEAEQRWEETPRPSPTLWSPAASTNGQVPLGDRKQEIMEDTVYRGRDPAAHKHREEVRIEKGMRMDTIQCTWSFSFQRNLCPLIMNLNAPI